MSNPVLIEVARGPLVESFHTGALAIAGASGPPLFSLGDVHRPVFPRSAVKAVQCLPLVETGAAPQVPDAAPQKCWGGPWLAVDDGN